MHKQSMGSVGAVLQGWESCKGLSIDRPKNQWENYMYIFLIEAVFGWDLQGHAVVMWIAYWL